MKGKLDYDAALASLKQVAENYKKGMVGQSDLDYDFTLILVQYSRHVIAEERKTN